MASFEFKLPDIGEGVHEGEIVAWHASPGERVAEDDPLVEVMTDKATVTIGAPQTGVVSELRFEVGDTAHVGDVLVVLEVEGEGAESVGAKEERAATAVGDISAHLPGTESYPEERTTGRVAAPPRERKGGDYFEDKPLATPATRKLARELDVDLRRVRPSRDDRRVTKDDVRAHAERGGSAPPARAPAAAADAGAGAGAGDRRVPFVGVRRRIAQHLQHATRTAAHFTFVEECEVGRLLSIRERLAPQAEEQGVKLTLLPFIIKAVTEALERHPVLNSYLDEETNELVMRRARHIGMATATDQGLLVPVLRDADRRSILDIAREVERLAEGARQGTLGRDELTGSTFTVTSLGKLGGLFATPILNHPEVGILGVHRIRERPVVRDGAVVVGNIMLLSLSFDHRIVDGHEGAAFAYDVIGYLEEPDRLFLEMA